ncbi:HIT domain-containing protein, partial [Enterococcus faecium]|uniref:HIT domain-containing protein n=1 Tax=Enterococcus faecium TaxID=1352 RepID=UPI001EE8E1D4
MINQEIPSYKIYEDDKVYAFLDISQATKGHTIVVPKRHVADINEYEPEHA